MFHPKLRLCFLRLLARSHLKPHPVFNIHCTTISQKIFQRLPGSAYTCPPFLLPVSCRTLHSLDTHSEMLIQELAASIDLSTQDISEIISQQPHLSVIPVETWKSLFQFFTEQGTPSYQVKDLILMCPVLLKADLNAIKATLLWWRTLKLGEERFFRVIRSCPQLLLLEVPALQARVNQLSTAFTSSDILDLAETCPQVFFEPWNTILAKIHYILHTVGLEQPYIIKSKAMKYSLTHIENRYQFLLRAGVFKPVRKKVAYHTLKNPSLEKVINSPEDAFVHLSGLSFEEYRVFCNLMKQERELNLLDADDALDDE